MSSSGRQRLGRQMTDQRNGDAWTLHQAKVTVVSADSPPKVTVSWDGGTYVLPHLPSYTPAVNDVVALAPYAGSYLILGRPVGFP